MLYEEIQKAYFIKNKMLIGDTKQSYQARQMQNGCLGYIERFLVRFTTC